MLEFILSPLAKNIDISLRLGNYHKQDLCDLAILLAPGKITLVLGQGVRNISLPKRSVQCGYIPGHRCQYGCVRPPLQLHHQKIFAQNIKNNGQKTVPNGCAVGTGPLSDDHNGNWLQFRCSRKSNDNRIVFIRVYDWR